MFIGAFVVQSAQQVMALLSFVSIQYQFNFFVFFKIKYLSLKKCDAF